MRSSSNHNVFKYPIECSLSQFVESPQWANMQVQRRKKAAANIESVIRSRHLEHDDVTDTRSVECDAHRRKNTSRSTNDNSLRGCYLEAAEMSFTQDEDVRAAATVEVTFKASTDVVFFQWPMERLQDFLHKNPGMSSPLNAIVGADVAGKLFSQTKAGEGSISSVQRRIYIPMDELEEAMILPRETEAAMEEGDESNSDIEVPLADGEEEMATEDFIGLQSNESAAHVSKSNDMLAKSPLHAEKLWLEKRGACDTSNDQRLSKILQRHSNMNRYEISTLLAKGRWRSILREGTVMIREGEPVNNLFILLNGKLSVHKGEGHGAHELHHILPPQLIGSIEFHEAESEHIAGETVTSLEPCTFISWDVDDLRELLKPRPHLRAQLTTIVAADLATKFRQVEDMV
mmetsp:Transcript_60017/g.177953  ORF Transcript_60017/g.177953 Transcript_60017/m.177953 type:complete len:403 (-) Transcript_60017:127-1335(-)